MGDPLIKGLTEVANQRPNNPIQFLANYLQNFANDGTPKTSSNNETKLRNGSVKKREEAQNSEAVNVKQKSPTKSIANQGKERSVDNVMDEDEFDLIPGADERGEFIE